ncbi:conserved membrane protein of unknown function [Burkholderia multivorans]
MISPPRDTLQQSDSVGRNDVPERMVSDNISYFFRFSVTLLGATLLVNFAALLYPTWLPGDGIATAIKLALSRYATPLAFCLIMLMTIPRVPKLIGTGRNVIVASLVVFAAYLGSLETNGLQVSSLAIACFFPLSAFVLFLFSAQLTEFNRTALKILVWTLGVWTTAPVLLVAFPSIRPAILDSFEWSFHGFSASRIEFGLWSCMFATLLWQRRAAMPRLAYLALMCLTLTGIYFAQSRAAVAALCLALSYFIFSSDLSSRTKVLAIAKIALIAGLVVMSWKLFGRQEPLEAINSTRHTITVEILSAITDRNLWVGAGTMVDVRLPDGTVTQAHNLILQWMANWGIVGTLALLAFLIVSWLWLGSLEARMLFLALAVFSMTQPVQGTANFFGPMTLAWFFVMICAETGALGRHLPRKSSLETLLYPHNRPSLADRPAP